MSHIALVLAMTLLGLLHIPTPTSAQDLPEGLLVRFESSDLVPGWHMGTVGLTKDGCVMIWKSEPKLIHGRIGFSLHSIQKLERHEGERWVETPLTPMMHKEPKKCHEHTG